MSVILMISLCYKALILQGEIWCWSLLGLKELNYVSLALFTSSMRPPFLTHKYDKKKKKKKNSGLLHWQFYGIWETNA